MSQVVTIPPDLRAAPAPGPPPPRPRTSVGAQPEHSRSTPPAPAPDGIEGGGRPRASLRSSRPRHQGRPRGLARARQGPQRITNPLRPQRWQLVWPGQAPHRAQGWHFSPRTDRMPPYRGACWRPHAEQPPELRDPKSGLSPTHSPPVLPAGRARGQSRERAEGLLLRCVFRGYGAGGGGSGGCSDYEISTGFAKQASGDGGLVCTPAEGG